VLRHRLPHTREHSRVGKGCQGGGEVGRYPLAYLRWIAAPPNTPRLVCQYSPRVSPNVEKSLPNQHQNPLDKRHAAPLVCL
jgi:hypothetical protein